MSTPSSFLTQISRVLDGHDLPHHGFAPLTKPHSFALYEAWLERGFNGDMGYLERHREVKGNPEMNWPRAKSAIVVTVAYHPHPSPQEEPLPCDRLRVALYARGKDYHHWLKVRLEAAARELRDLFPGDEFLPMTDSSPVLERDLAYRAGLGWVGKNTCLIHPKRGSLFFIGEILTSRELPAAELPVHDHCGTCTRCLDACPTQALIAPRELDARRCISYLTIESKSVAPPDLRAAMSDWFFGCDICQTVCPWNLKWHGHEAMAEETRGSNAGPEKERGSRPELLEDLGYILGAGSRELERAFQGSPLERAGAVGLRRNALVVIGNLRLIELRSAVQSYQSHARLGELATWCLEKLNASSA